MLSKKSTMLKKILRQEADKKEFQKHNLAQKVGLGLAGLTLLASSYYYNPERLEQKEDKTSYVQLYKKVEPIAHATAAYIVGFGLTYGYKKNKD